MRRPSVRRLPGKRERPRPVAVRRDVERGPATLREALPGAFRVGRARLNLDFGGDGGIPEEGEEG